MTDRTSQNFSFLSKTNLLSLSSNRKNESHSSEVQMY